MQEHLEQLVQREIENIKKSQLDDRITGFWDFKNKYAILKSTVTIEISLTDGKKAIIDVTDLFKENLK